MSTLALLLALALPTQVSDAALRDRVATLIEKLDAPKAEARDSAEQSLIKLGPKILPLLPDEAKDKAERSMRVDRIKKAIRESMDQVNLGASKVTIRGQGIRLTEALKQLQSQSGNLVTDVREQMGAEATNSQLDLEIVDKTFFEAVEEIAAKAGLSINAFTGDGSIGLAAGAMPGAAMPANGAPIQRPGPYRVILKQVGSLRDFQTGTATTTVQLEVGWEPRLRPMLLTLKGEGIEVVDDKGRKVAVSAADMGTTDLPLRPENPAAELNLTLMAPERDALKLASVKVKGEITVPAGLRSFKFDNLARRDVVVKQGDIAVTLESTEVDEQVWKVNVLAAYPEGGPAFESYRQGLFNNRLWLQKADGSRFEHNGGFSNTASADGKLGFEYLFVDAPGRPSDYALVYETPSKVLTIPLEVEFKDVPLP